MLERYSAIKDPKPRALIIRCGDPRFRVAFRHFAEKKLGLHQGDFVLIEIGGGPAALAHRRSKPKDFQFLISQIRFFLGHFPSIREIILFGHQDCGFYKTIANHPDKENPEKKDLPRAAKTLSNLRSIKVESYYAGFADESRNEIIFEKI